VKCAGAGLCEEPEGRRFERQAHADVILHRCAISASLSLPKLDDNHVDLREPREHSEAEAESGW
jgi:hypothetical protein